MSVSVSQNSHDNQGNHRLRSDHVRPVEGEPEDAQGAQASNQVAKYFHD